MMLCKNTKVKVHLPDGDTDYFDILADVLQGDTLALYLFIICIDYALRTSIHFMKKMVSSWHKQPAEDAPYKLLRTQTMPMT